MHPLKRVILRKERNNQAAADRDPPHLIFDACYISLFDPYDDKHMYSLVNHSITCQMKFLQVVCLYYS